MKKLLMAALVVFLSGSLMAGNGDLFSYDKEEVQQELSTMNDLEQYVGQHQGVTLSDLQAENNELTMGMENSPNSVLGGLGYGDPPLGVPSFVWGCVLSWVGILVVYLVTEDNDETKKALWGCVAGAVGWSLFYVVYYVIILGVSY